MCHGNKSKSGNTVRFKTDEPRHKNAIPYKRSKSKKDFRDYEELAILAKLTIVLNNLTHLSKMAKETKAQKQPVVLTAENVVEQAKAGNMMTQEMVDKMNEELQAEKDKNVIAETKRRYTKIAYVVGMSLVHKRKSSDYNEMSTYNIRQLGRLQRFLCGFTVTEQIVGEFARTEDDILKLETLDEKKKTLTIQMPGADGKRESKEFKVGDKVDPVISYIEFDKGVELLEKKLTEKKKAIEDKHVDEVKTIKMAAGEYWRSDWAYNLKIVTMDGLEAGNRW